MAPAWEKTAVLAIVSPVVEAPEWEKTAVLAIVPLVVEAICITFEPDSRINWVQKRFNIE